MSRNRPWPFVGKSLFTINPAHDSDDAEVFAHVLKHLREDFEIDTENKDPRFQILLDDVVSSYTELGAFKSRITPGDNQENVRRHELKLRSAVRKALDSIMKYKNSTKKETKHTFSLESLLSKADDD